MKRLLLVIALCVMTFWGSTKAYSRDFGIVAGASFTGVRDVSRDNVAGYHAGITYKFRLPVGFAIQPSVLYHMKGSMVEDALSGNGRLDMRVGYLEVPVSFQWGPDLVLFRPYLDVTPFVGYGLNNKLTAQVAQTGGEQVVKNSWDNLSRLEYGLGTGIGLELWRLQIVGRYNWNFGNLFNPSGELVSGEEVVDALKNSVLQGKNMSGFTISVALMF